METLHHRQQRIAQIVIGPGGGDVFQRDVEQPAREAPPQIVHESVQADRARTHRGGHAAHLDDLVVEQTLDRRNQQVAAGGIVVQHRAAGHARAFADRLGGQPGMAGLHQHVERRIEQLVAGFGAPLLLRAPHLRTGHLPLPGRSRHVSRLRLYKKTVKTVCFYPQG